MMRNTPRIIIQNSIEQWHILKEDNTDVDLIVIPFSQTHYNTAWDIYESIALNLPLQRVHPEGECNADMMSRFSAEEDSEDNSTEISF